MKPTYIKASELIPGDIFFKAFSDLTSKVKSESNVVLNFANVVVAYEAVTIYPHPQFPNCRLVSAKPVDMGLKTKIDYLESSGNVPVDALVLVLRE